MCSACWVFLLFLLCTFMLCTFCLMYPVSLFRYQWKTMGFPTFDISFRWLVSLLVLFSTKDGKWLVAQCCLQLNMRKGGDCLFYKKKKKRKMTMWLNNILTWNYLPAARYSPTRCLKKFYCEPKLYKLLSRYFYI